MPRSMSAEALQRWAHRLPPRTQALLKSFESTSARQVPQTRDAGTQVSPVPSPRHRDDSK